MTPTVTVARSLRGSVPSIVVRELTRRLRRAAQRLSVDTESLSTLAVRIVDDAEMSRLRLTHMNLGGPTDVLSFPAGEMPGDTGAAGGPLGDIVIDWKAVHRQARGPSRDALIDETVGLAVHGLVHLLGHDHGTRAQARAMLRLERVAARGARLPPLRRPYGGTP